MISPPLIITTVAAEVARIAGEHLTPAACTEIAERAVKIIDDYNRSVSITAMETAKQAMIEASVVSAAKEPNETK